MNSLYIFILVAVITAVAQHHHQYQHIQKKTWIQYITSGSGPPFQQPARSLRRGRTAMSKIIKKSNGVFSQTYYDAIRSHKGNILISPLSINYAITGISLGTVGRMAKDMRNLLAQPFSDDEIKTSYGTFTKFFMYNRNVRVVTEIYIDESLYSSKTFQNYLATHFNTKTQEVDFSDKLEKSRVTINNHFNNASNHLVPQLFKKGKISKDTSYIIANVAYFQSDWKYPFHKEMTVRKPFHGQKHNSRVDMMFQAAYFYYKEDNDLNAQLLSLPYKDGGSFLIILPNNNVNITDVEEKIKSRAARSIISSPFSDIFKNLKEEYVSVSLPKFSYKQAINMTNFLPEMGANILFTNAANVESFLRRPTEVRQIIQRTYISVDEKGTRAVASKELRQKSVSIPPARFPFAKQFNTDHPFIFLIVYHGPLDTPYIIGRINDIK